MPIQSMWVIYDHPSDFPDVFIARKWGLTKTGFRPTERIITGATLDEVRKRINKTPNLYLVPREPLDDPKIVEVWL